MDNKLLLAKSISLLYRESQFTEKSENSSTLVRTVLDNIGDPTAAPGTTNNEAKVITALKQTVLEMCNQPQDHTYDKNDLLQRVRINCYEDDKFYEGIKQGVEEDLSDTRVKNVVLNIRKAINNHFKEQQIGAILTNAHSTFRFRRESIKDINQFITDISAQLEPLQLNGGSKDPALISEIDIGNDEETGEAFSKVISDNDSDVYVTGWQDLNEMLQGGFRPGECVVVPALQHKNKTGFTLSLFDQIPLYNKPKTKIEGKKPLLLRISTEDELPRNLQFMYQALKYNETGEYVLTKGLDIKEMSAYVKDRLQVNGFHIKLIRIDPTLSTYKTIINKVTQLEANGYNVEVLMIDYLAMIPTIGCINTGAMGTDIRDLFRRIRNFCAAKGILLITPHQLSTEAKNLLRSGLPEDEFVKDIAEKGYYSGTKQLDQEVDLEIYIHIFKHLKKTFMSVQRGKHRLPTILPDDKKYFLLEFPKFAPIPDDIHKEGHVAMRKLPKVVTTDEDYNY